MIISAKFASVCPSCSARIVPGTKVEWSKGAKAKHVVCGSTAPVATAIKAPSSNWDPTAFRGYGRPRGAFRKACVSDGNCSSFGSGRSCGGHDCDGM